MDKKYTPWGNKKIELSADELFLLHSAAIKAITHQNFVNPKTVDFCLKALAATLQTWFDHPDTCKRMIEITKREIDAISEEDDDIDALAEKLEELAELLKSHK